MGLIEVAQHNLETHFVDNPCRGIVLGVNEQGLGMQIAWIMGRSANSRNRVYDQRFPVMEPAGILQTQAADPSKVEDSRLIIYNVMRSRGKMHVVSNGDQTDTVLDDENFPDPGFLCLTGAEHFYEVLDDRYCEPDAPIFTPRITGSQYSNQLHRIFLSVLKAEPFAVEHWRKTEKEANDSGLTRKAFEASERKPQEVNDLYLNEIDRRAGLDRKSFPTLHRQFRQEVRPGFGYCVTTYMPGAEDLRSFIGEPLLLPMTGKIGDVMKRYWDSLRTIYKGEDCRVSLGGRVLLSDGRVGLATPINRYEKVA